MIEFPLLSLLTFLPLIGALFIMTIRGEQELVARNARYAAFYTSGFTLALALFMLWLFDAGNSDYQFVERSEWLPALGLEYYLGVDGISLFFVLLSTFLTPVCIIASWSSVKHRVKEFLVALMVLETMMIGAFTALDTILFYLFFEGVLIPMFFMIGIWGGANRIYASYKFFLYTLLGSVLMLLAMLSLMNMAGTSAIPDLPGTEIAFGLQIWLWLAFFASFAVKMPMWPVHTWLPDAHVEAPTAGSVLLAGILLKMGGYGFLRFSLPVFPEASAFFAEAVFALSVVAIIYTSLVALVQTDMKKLIAYSSVAHMGFVTLGIFTATQAGLAGGVFQMISHGVISGALFLCVGVVYDRLHTREIARYGGLVRNMPKYAVLFMVFTLGSVGLPGTSGFVGEFLGLMGAYQVHTVYASLAALGVVFGAAYMLYLYRQMFFGPQENKDAAALKDLTGKEFLILVPLALLVLYWGVKPNFILDRINPSVERVLEQYESGLEKARGGEEGGS